MFFATGKGGVPKPFSNRTWGSKEILDKQPEWLAKLVRCTALVHHNGGAEKVLANPVLIANLRKTWPGYQPKSKLSPSKLLLALRKMASQENSPGSGDDGSDDDEEVPGGDGDGAPPGGSDDSGPGN